MANATNLPQAGEVGKPLRAAVYYRVMRGLQAWPRHEGRLSLMSSSPSQGPGGHQNSFP